MYIESLDVQNFRNIISAHLEFSPGFHVIYGDNAQGKSNLLEAIYTLAFLKGFRGDRLLHMITFDSAKAFLRADVCNGASRTALGVEIDSDCRRAYVDGAPCIRARDYLGLLRAILFVPMDVGFLQSAPANRRTSLDRMVFNLHPAYLIDLDQYQKLIKQKSAALRAEVPDENLLRVYDDQIRPIAVRLIEARYDYLRMLSPHIRRVFASIFDDACDCHIAYKSATMRDEIAFDGAGSPSRDDVVAAYLDSQRNALPKEILRQQVGVGPHRDDWTIQLNGRQARYFASQGQQRAMSLAMKIAEISCLKAEADIEPVFLLDDVSSELDPVRHKKLFGYLNALSTQTFLTTTSRDYIHIDNVSRMFHVQNGSITHAE